MTPTITRRPTQQTLTKARRLHALRIMTSLRQDDQITVIETGGLPRVDRDEAIRICARYGLIETRYERTGSSEPIRLIDLAVYIARCL